MAAEHPAATTSSRREYLHTAPRAFVKRLGSLARIFGVREIPGRTTILYAYGECDNPLCRGLNKDGTCPNGYGATCLGYRDRMSVDV